MADMAAELHRVDESVAQWAAKHVSPRHTEWLTRITHLGGTETAVAAGALSALVDRARTGSWHGTLRLVTIIGGQNLIHNGVKAVVRRHRPRGPHHAHFAGSSFPSGHTTTAAATWPAVAATLTRSPLLRAMSLAAGPLVGATRVLLGVHWLSDVLAGLAIGWGWLGFVRRASRT